MSHENAVTGFVEKRVTEPGPQRGMRHQVVAEGPAWDHRAARHGASAECHLLHHRLPSTARRGGRESWRPGEVSLQERGCRRAVGWLRAGLHGQSLERSWARGMEGRGEGETGKGEGRGRGKDALIRWEMAEWERSVRKHKLL